MTSDEKLAKNKAILAKIAEAITRENITGQVHINCTGGYVSTDWQKVFKVRERV